MDRRVRAYTTIIELYLICYASRVRKILQYDGMYVIHMNCVVPRNAKLFDIVDGADKGIIPLTCSELFVRMRDKTAADPNLMFTVEVSYIEVHDTILDDACETNSDSILFRFTTRKYEICSIQRTRGISEFENIRL